MPALTRKKRRALQSLAEVALRGDDHAIPATHALLTSTSTHSSSCTQLATALPSPPSHINVGHSSLDTEKRPQIQIPDEILKEILIQVSGVIITSSEFLDTGRRSPFFDSQHTSTSIILSVSKQWLRVATPLIYHTVILRSKAQAQALARVLCPRKKMCERRCVEEGKMCL